MPRKVEAELRIGAGPDAVWRAIAEAEGLREWFAPEARVEPGEGGSVWVSWGSGMEGTSRIVVWEPLRRFGYAYDRAQGREPNVVDFTIEASGGGTALRLVNSGFGDDPSFDDEYETTSHAWPLFLLLLKHGLEHRHERCVNVALYRTFEAPRGTAWKQLNDGPAIDGERLHFDEAGYTCYQLRGMNSSLLAIFCETWGSQTALTIMCLLYDATPEQEARARAAAEALASKVS